jgi:hypothetical protein
MTDQPSTLSVGIAAALMTGAIAFAAADDAYAAGGGRSHASVPASCGSQCVAKPPTPTRSLTAPTGPARLTNPCPHGRGGTGGPLGKPCL